MSKTSPSRTPSRFIARCIALLATAFFFAAGSAARAEIKTLVECNKEEQATAAFKFAHVPAPSSSNAAATNAAAKAKFSVVNGDIDPNSGGLVTLNDGKLPKEEDEPDANFFFNADTPGGRLAVDLGKVIGISQINTYSWHPNTRGPQVYKLYASLGAGTKFNAAPKTGTDPATCGWRLIATVDTRPKTGEPGGQYGVSISNPAGEVGKFRYLLFDMATTETDDTFGNTFYSEIDVIEAVPPVKPVLINSSPAGAKYDIKIDYTETPELKTWIETKLRPAVDKWYPIIVDSLPSKGYTAPKRFTITFKQDMGGVAYTSGTSVVCAGPWFNSNLDGEAVGAVIHELVHVVQQIHQRNTPGWLVEGSADYIRWFKYEPKPTGTRPRELDTASYTNSYRITAGFLNYLSQKHDKEIVSKLNADMRDGNYSDELFKKYAGKSLDDLWKDYIASLRK